MSLKDVTAFDSLLFFLFFLSSQQWWNINAAERCAVAGSDPFLIHRNRVGVNELLWTMSVSASTSMLHVFMSRPRFCISAQKLHLGWNGKSGNFPFRVWTRRCDRKSESRALWLFFFTLQLAMLVLVALSFSRSIKSISNLEPFVNNCKRSTQDGLQHYLNLTNLTNLGWSSSFCTLQRHTDQHWRIVRHPRFNNPPPPPLIYRGDADKQAGQMFPRMFYSFSKVKKKKKKQTRLNKHGMFQRKYKTVWIE